jgi:spermidine synthase
VLRRALLGLVPGLAACVTARAIDPDPLAARNDEERVIATASSDYNDVVVTQQGSLRRMYFVVDDGHGGTKQLLQSTYDLERPNSLDHEVFQTMVAGLLVQPRVQRVCMVGVGGAQLSNFLFARLLDIELDAVDICPAVVELARAHFGVPDDPRYRLHVGDGRVFVEQAAAASFDLLILDAYRGHSVPRHLRTREFFSVCRDRLTPGGAVVANMHRLTPRYPIDRATIASVFRHSVRFASADDVQTAIVATDTELAITSEQLIANAHAVQPRIDFDMLGLARRCTFDPDWGDAMPIVDDFGPTELDSAADQNNRSCTPTCAGD